MKRSHASINAAADKDVYEFAVTSTSMSSMIDLTTRTSALIKVTFETLQSGIFALQLTPLFVDIIELLDDAPIEAIQSASLIRSNHSDPAGEGDEDK